MTFHTLKTLYSSFILPHFTYGILAWGNKTLYSSFILPHFTYGILAWGNKTLYSSFILPHFTYGILAWGNKTDKLLKIQKRAVRTVTLNKYNAHTEPQFKRLEILKTHDLYKLNILKFYFKYKHSELPNFFQSFSLQPRSLVHQYNTQIKTQLNVNETKWKFAENCIRNQVALIVNKTQSNILDKIDTSTHSLEGYCNYIKYSYLNTYTELSSINNCYVCQN